MNQRIDFNQREKQTKRRFYQRLIDRQAANHEKIFEIHENVLRTSIGKTRKQTRKIFVRTKKKKRSVFD